MLTIHVKQLFDGYALRFSGDDFRPLVASLKDFIPSHLRRYDPEKRSWHIDRAASDLYRDWLSYARTRLDAEVVDEQKPGAAPRVSELSAFDVLCLKETAPPELVKAAYRVLSLLHHPDKGGDVRQMQAINEAYEFLEKRLAA